MTVQPLAGTRVLDLGSWVTAPYAAMLLADLGAEVIKVEKPGHGDPLRAPAAGDYSSFFVANNRSKKSLTVDLRHPEGKKIVEALVRESDALVENFRLGFLDELGLGYDALSKINPRLVYLSCTGFGPTGPYIDRPSYDTVGQALSGLMGISIDHSDLQFFGTSISDSLTGLYNAYGLLGGLLLRERTGRGVRIDTNMVASTLAVMEIWIVDFLRSGRITSPTRKSEVSLCFALRCSDDKLLTIHLSSLDKFWTGILAVTGSEKLANDPRYATKVSRNEHYEDMRADFIEIFAQKPRSYWMPLLEAHDVPFAPIYTVDEVPDDPQIRHLELVRELEHREKGRLPMVVRPVWFDGDAGHGAAFAPPTVGEHTDEILASLNYSAAEITRLRGAGII
jgi:formyl-CoA transferase